MIKQLIAVDREAELSRLFKIGVSAQIRKNDGTMVIPEVDISPLTSDPRIDVISLPDVGGGELASHQIGDVDALILMLEQVGDHSFTTNQNLMLIARYGVGFDTVDVEACTSNGVLLTTAPEGVRRPVATTVIGLLLALTLRIPDKDRITREGEKGWAVKTDFNGTGLVGRTLGGIGLGNIGAEVFRLVQPFDMQLIAHDPYVDPVLAQQLNIELVDLNEVFSRSDVVTVNCPLNAATHHLVGTEQFSLMKKTAYLINTARGPVVDEQALIDALHSNSIAGAGLDVFEHEPVALDNPLLQMTNVILSPHALCFTDQCMAGIGAADVAACLDFINGQSPSLMINPQVLEQSQFMSRRRAVQESMS